MEKTLRKPTAMSMQLDFFADHEHQQQQSNADHEE
jgi:hypothetical protein